jgi:hypothetical protein
LTLFKIFQLFNCILICHIYLFIFNAKSNASNDLTIALIGGRSDIVDDEKKEEENPQISTETT